MTTTTPHLRIWQQNLNKSRTAAFNMANLPLHQDWDIICIQEQYTNGFDAIITNRKWTPVYPDLWSRDKKASRSLILVNASIDTNTWRPLVVPGTNDITAIQISTDAGEVTIFNIYYDGTKD
ncbi:hypothetical protein K523DRAFT_255927, partial [Schizophyllum commune Tattone D]